MIRDDNFHMPFRKNTLLDPIPQNIFNLIKLNLFVDPVILMLLTIPSTFFFFSILILMEFLKSVDSVLNVFIIFFIKLQLLHTK